MGTTSVRRNLFNNHLSKRAMSTVPPMQGSGSNTSNVQSSRSGSSSETNSSSLNMTTGSTDNEEIVVKDKNGGYKLDIPVLAPVVGGEDGDEIEGFDESQNGGGSGATVVSTGETEIGGREKESMCHARREDVCICIPELTLGEGIEASLIEMMCRNRNRQMNSEPAGECTT